MRSAAARALSHQTKFGTKRQRQSCARPVMLVAKSRERSATIAAK